MANFGSNIGAGIGGGASEIAAVSVGVYPNTQPLTVGLQEAKVEVQHAAAEMAVAGKAAGHGFSQNFVGKLVEGGGALRHAAHTFTKTITSAMLVGEIAVGAFEVGSKIGEAIFGGTEESFDHLKKQVDDLGDYARKQLGEKFAEFGKAREKGGGPGLILIDVEGEQKRLEEVSAAIPKAQRELIETHNRVLRLQDGFSLLPDPEALRTFRALQDKEADQAQTLKALENERAGILSKIQGLKKAAADQADREAAAEKELKAATLEREASERRIAAQRDVQANRTAADISRMRQLMELGQRQRYGPSPGFGIQRGGRDR